MSLSSTGSWVGLLRYVLDDDQRTDRAARLLSHVTAWLLIALTAAATVALIALKMPWPASAGLGVSGIGAAAASQVLRRRRAPAAALRES